MAIDDAIQYRKFVDGIGVNGSRENFLIACMVHTSKSWDSVSRRIEIYRAVTTLRYNSEALQAKATPSCA